MDEKAVRSQRGHTPRLGGGGFVRAAATATAAQAAAGKPVCTPAEARTAVYGPRARAGAIEEGPAAAFAGGIIHVRIGNAVVERLTAAAAAGAVSGSICHGNSPFMTKSTASYAHGGPGVRRASLDGVRKSKQTCNTIRAFSR